jgi:hypothetical protein
LGRSFIVFGTVTLLMCGCSDNGPATPTTVTRALAPSQIAAGTVLTIVSGETGMPVPNARVEIAGKSFAADADGRLALAEPFAPDSTLDIVDPGFLDRQTRLREPAASTRYPLWPRTSPTTGLDETSTFELSYGTLDRSRSMMRIVQGTRTAYIVPSPQIRADAGSMERIRQTAETMTSITHDEIQFVVVDEAPADVVAFELVIDPGDPALVGAIAVAKRRLRNWSIIGGTVVYGTLGTVRTSTTAHELGHMFGLAHSSSREDVMQPGRSNRADGFSAREALTMRLMLKRPAGNEMPDNDRNASPSALRAPDAVWLSVIACR